MCISTKWMCYVLRFRAVRYSFLSDLFMFIVTFKYWRYSGWSVDHTNAVFLNLNYVFPNGLVAELFMDNSCQLVRPTSTVHLSETNIV